MLKYSSTTTQIRVVKLLGSSKFLFYIKCLDTERIVPIQFFFLSLIKLMEKVYVKFSLFLVFEFFPWELYSFDFLINLFCVLFLLSLHKTISFPWNFTVTYLSYWYFLVLLNLLNTYQKPQNKISIIFWRRAVINCAHYI